MNAAFALAPVSTWAIGDWLIAIVIFAACVAVVYVALNQYGVAIPQWVVKIFWIVVVAVVAIFALRFLLSL